MNLYRVVYASTLSESFKSDDIEDLLAKSRRNNDRRDLSGLLLFSKDYFLQCIEGSRENVNFTYQRILRDERHTDIIMLSYENIPKREFGAWSMGYVSDTKLTKSRLLTYSATANFNPYTLSNQSAIGLLMSLQQTL